MNTAAKRWSEPPEQKIIAPAGGWKDETLYLVHVSYSPNNPVHEAYLQVGFLTGDGRPGGYTSLYSNGYEAPHTMGDVYYLAPLKLLHTRHEAVEQPLNLEPK